MRDDLREIIEAIKSLTPSARAPGCWCESSWDVEGAGHSPRCEKVRAALALARVEQGAKVECTDCARDAVHVDVFRDSGARFPCCGEPTCCIVPRFGDAEPLTAELAAGVR